MSTLPWTAVTICLLLVRAATEYCVAAGPISQRLPDAERTVANYIHNHTDCPIKMATKERLFSILNFALNIERSVYVATCFDVRPRYTGWHYKLQAFLLKYCTLSSN
jgi:hypothetical protein